MGTITKFSEQAKKDLGNYVYRLIDPRNGETFYVGKGTGDRVFQHALGKLESDVAPDEGSDDLKSQIINGIHFAGLNVVHVIHRHNLRNDVILDVEAALIDAYPGLSNIQGGRGSHEYGPMHVQQIMNKYDLPELDQNPDARLILISINRLQSKIPDEIYKQVRFAWRVDLNRVRKADYVLAVVRGVIVGVFIAKRWDVAIQENFTDIPFDVPEKKAFEGYAAPADIWEYYVGKQGKRITNKEMRHIQNPVKYWP